jgi:hypothetical protein
VRAIGALIVALALLLGAVLVAVAPLHQRTAVPGRGVTTIPAPGPDGGPPS